MAAINRNNGGNTNIQGHRERVQKQPGWIWPMNTIGRSERQSTPLVNTFSNCAASSYQIIRIKLQGRAGIFFAFHTAPGHGDRCSESNRNVCSMKLVIIKCSRKRLIWTLAEFVIQFSKPRFWKLTMLKFEDGDGQRNTCPSLWYSNPPSNSTGRSSHFHMPTHCWFWCHYLAYIPWRHQRVSRLPLQIAKQVDTASNI